MAEKYCMAVFEPMSLQDTSKGGSLIRGEISKLNALTTKLQQLWPKNAKSALSIS